MHRLGAPGERARLPADRWASSLRARCLQEMDALLKIARLGYWRFDSSEVRAALKAGAAERSGRRAMAAVDCQGLLAAALSRPLAVLCRLPRRRVT